MFFALTPARFGLSRSVALAAGLLTSLSFINVPAAHAQSLVATVNDSPITNRDVEQRARLLRVLHKNTAHDAVMESIYESRLKLTETSKYTLKPSEQDAVNEIARLATELKVKPQALYASIQGSKTDKAAWIEYFGALSAWRTLVGALNKNVNVSETEVRAEVAKQGSKASNEYRLRQVIFIVPANASGAIVQSRAQQAEQLRGRFSDCDAGLQLARGMSEVVVKEQTSRSAGNLAPEMIELLEKTPTGHLTPPQRGAQGIEMIAVCGKSDAGSESGIAENIRQTILGKRLEEAGAKLYKPLRDRAIIVQRR
jgi:peptidyl-prolyl cis-trans isomerase SurA